MLLATDTVQEVTVTRFLIVTVALGVLGCGADGTGQGSVSDAKGGDAQDATTAGGRVEGPDTFCNDSGCYDIPAGGAYVPENHVLYCANADKCTEHVWGVQDAQRTFRAKFEPVVVGDRCSFGLCDNKDPLAPRTSNTTCQDASSCKTDSDCPEDQTCTLYFGPDA